MINLELLRRDLIFLRLAPSQRAANFMTSLRRHESDAEQAGLTLHAACGDVLKSLRRCMRSHNLPGDPFALPTLGRRAELLGHGGQGF